MMSTDAPCSNGESKAMEARSSKRLVEEFLLQREPIFRRLNEVRKKGWLDTRGDDHFKKQRSRAENAGENGARIFYNMMQQIGDELQETTNALNQLADCDEDVKILDLCMAPGGYTASALKYNPGATAFGITLPPSQGGYDMLFQSPRSTVLYLDITNLAKEFGVDTIPQTHPEHASFIGDRPYLEHTFQLVFCDGQVLRKHLRGEYREQQEAARLQVSQLILALQRIRTGGTMVMLLHKIEAWHNVELLYLFSQFSSVQVFKPEKKHAIRSSFYLVAKNVQPKAIAARSAIEMWKQDWWQATFGGQNGTGAMKEAADECYVEAVLEEFGRVLIELGRPVWQIQANALSRKDFAK